MRAVRLRYPSLTRRSTTPWVLTLSATVTLAAACASAPPPASHQSAVTAERGATDLALANAVYAALVADPIYFFRHVDVRVDGGVADLSGFVWSTDAIYRARRIATGVPGVTGVVTSHLELERNGRDSAGPTR